MKVAVLFPGQGSQYLGMGKEFVDSDTECAALMEMAETTCELNLGSLCTDGTMEELTRATNLQPAITITNLICWHAFQKAVGEDFEVSCFAGHSLGEYSALFAAGIVSAEDTMKLVSKRGALMEREGEVNPGGMRAVLGLSIEEIEEIISTYTGSGVVTAANHNTPQQIVISGSKEGLDAVTAKAEEQGAKVIPLNVSVANHSPLVAGAVPDFEEFMDEIEFKKPQTPVYFNVSSGTEGENGKIKSMMARQIASKVRWCEIIQSMMADGVDTFIEIGPKNILKGMMRKIAPKGVKITSLQFDSPESLGKCLAKLELN
ncbi:MAG: malonyl CoA-acyl carrier protein transacylase [Desulfobulbaceae bacterium S3730MH12]|nr:MAG: malonyl CoA-acyl carrier protein transacylase [Desulfobulbaceae bacterium S3730MH12]OEU78449.1 MAG: malonyl CoA-acyl carrier protein transacylase [Desulfobulbaceae bacterium C00003063]